MFCFVFWFASIQSPAAVASKGEETNTDNATTQRNGQPAAITATEAAAASERINSSPVAASEASQQHRSVIVNGGLVAFQSTTSESLYLDAAGVSEITSYHDVAHHHPFTVDEDLLPGSDSAPDLPLDDVSLNSLQGVISLQDVNISVTDQGEAEVPLVPFQLVSEHKNPSGDSVAGTIVEKKRKKTKSYDHLAHQTPPCQGLKKVTQSERKYSERKYSEAPKSVS